ncbi:hypothetical protein A2U01_0041427, partial [Trifolium medium]|nr:hypothetical protein [Trifolium medium]
MKPQQKQDDRKSLPIPCSIWEMDTEGALCDLDSNINLMTFSLVRRLTRDLADDPWEQETRNMTLILADHNKIYPWGIIKDVPIKVNDLVILVDFVIIDPDEDEIPVIFGKPFLAASRAL